MSQISFNSDPRQLSPCFSSQGRISLGQKEAPRSSCLDKIKSIWKKFCELITWVFCCRCYSKKEISLQSQTTATSSKSASNKEPSTSKTTSRTVLPLNPPKQTQTKPSITQPSSTHAPAKRTSSSEDINALLNQLQRNPPNPPKINIPLALPQTITIPCDGLEGSKVSAPTIPITSDKDDSDDIYDAPTPKAASPSVELYKSLHKIARQHFDGKNTLVASDKVDDFSTFERTTGQQSSTAPEPKKTQPPAIPKKVFKDQDPDTRNKVLEFLDEKDLLACEKVNKALRKECKTDRYWGPLLQRRFSKAPIIEQEGLSAKDRYKMYKQSQSKERIGPNPFAFLLLGEELMVMDHEITFYKGISKVRDVKASLSQESGFPESRLVLKGFRRAQQQQVIPILPGIGLAQIAYGAFPQQDDAIFNPETFEQPPRVSLPIMPRTRTMYELRPNPDAAPADHDQDDGAPDAANGEGH